MSRRLCAVRLTNATYLDLWLETAAQHRINHFSNCFKIKMHPLKKGAELASGRRQTRCTTRQSAHAQIEILSPENLLPKHSTKQISCLKKNSRQKASKGQFYRQSLLLLAHSFHFLHEYHAIHCKVESNAPVNFNG